MVNPLDILRKGKETLEELDEASKSGLERIREILPLSRGGSGGGRDLIADETSFVYETADPIPLRPAFDPPEVPLEPAINPGSGFRAAFERRDERMRTEDTIRNMINDPMVTVTSDMLDIINDPGILMDRNLQLFRNQFARSELLRGDPKKKKKKVSKYQKELGKQLKLLKKKHPRTPISNLMKRAHRLTKKALKMK